MGRSELDEQYLAWLPRFLSHGVDYNDFVATVSTVDRWEDWLEAWVRAGSVHETLGREAKAGGNSRTAGDAFLRASLYFHYAKYLWLEDADLYWETTRQSVALHREGLEILDPTFERLEIAFDPGPIVANLRMPRHRTGPVPLVIVIPGMDSTKEEFTAWENVFLDRDMATASLDGPGQGESGVSNPMRPDHEVAVSALIDVLSPRDDIDGTRLGITGVGLGGYLATRSAAFEPRIAAAGVIGGAYRFSVMPEIIKAKFMFNAGIEDPKDAESYSARFSIDGIMENLTQPYLVIHGGRDAVMTVEAAEQAARAAANGEFLLYQEGNTSCQSVNHIVRPALADWLGARLAVGSYIADGTSGERP